MGSSLIFEAYNSAARVAGGRPRRDGGAGLSGASGAIFGFVIRTSEADLRYPVERIRPDRSLQQAGRGGLTADARTRLANRCLDAPARRVTVVPAREGRPA